MGILPESSAVNGDGTYSYNNNSHHKQQNRGIAISKPLIDEVISEKLDLTIISSTSNTFRLADLGCSIGPNTFHCVEIILEAVKQKFMSQGFTSDEFPEFQVFFNDLPFNDFNTLFQSLPPEIEYFPAGVPGTFFGRLFPESSLHFANSFYALQWLSKVPEEVLYKDSAAWNKGRIHYSGAPEAVVNAFATQFAKDMGMFLDARAKELVQGGIMVLIMPAIPDGIPHCNGLLPVTLHHLGSCLMDMVIEGLICESQVDSLNIPMYSATPKEIRNLIERNGCFTIEKMENASTDCGTGIKPTAFAIMKHFRIGLEALINSHFRDETFSDKLFDRCYKKIDEYIHFLSPNTRGCHLTIILKRR